MSATEHARDTRRETLFRVAVIVVCAVVTVVAIVLYALKSPTTPDNFTNSFTTASGGHHAFVELLKESGRQVDRESVTLTLPEYNGWSGNTLMLLEPRADFVDQYRSELTELLKQATETHSSVVLVLPKRQYRPLRREGDEQILREEILSIHQAQTLLEMTGLGNSLRVARELTDNVRVKGQAASGANVEATLREPAQVLRPVSTGGWFRQLPSNARVIARTANDDILAVRITADETESRGGLIIVSDPDMFSNRFLNEPGMAAMAMLMLETAPPQGTIVVDEKLHGFSGETSIAYLMLTTPGLWVTLSVLLSLLIFGWRQGTVLRPHSAEVQDRAARLYAIEGLARMLERAGHHGEAMRRILRRSRLLLGQAEVQVHEAGRGTGIVRPPAQGRISIVGSTSEDQLVNVARSVAARRRAGESGGPELWS